MNVNVAVDPNTVVVLLCVAGIIQIGVHVIKRALDVWFDTAGRKTADPIGRLADSLKEPSQRDTTEEIAPKDEPWWDGKAPHKPATRRLFALHETAVVIGDNPARFDVTGYHSTSGMISDTPPETAAETSGRHALIQGDDTATGLMAAVDDEPAMAALAVVSGGDGAT